MCELPTSNTANDPALPLAAHRSQQTNTAFRGQAESANRPSKHSHGRIFPLALLV